MLNTSWALWIVEAVDLLSNKYFPKQVLLEVEACKVIKTDIWHRPLDV